MLDIHVTCPDTETAGVIAEALLDRRLVACGNIHGPVESLYLWKGAVERSQEVLLILKTRTELFDQVAEAIRALHPYEVPAIHAVPALRVTDATAAWLAAETTPE